jgi:hypothetical protein
MAIVITTNDVKRKCMIEGSDYDTEISALIAEMQGAIEETILDEHLENIGDTNLQKALTLGILELICAEMIDQINRQVGETEEFKAGAITIKAKEIDGERLRREGTARLAPYRKPTFTPATANVALES